MKKTTSCKRATELSIKTSLLIGQKNIFGANQGNEIQPLLELVRQVEVPRGSSALEVNFHPKISHCPSKLWVSEDGSDRECS